MQRVELCGLVAGPLAVDQLGKKKFFQKFAFGKDCCGRKLGPEGRDIPPRRDTDFVPCVGGARINCLHNDIRVEEMRCNHVRAERCVCVLKDNGQDVVANVALALKLLGVVVNVRQQGGHVLDDLASSEGLIEGVFTSLAVFCVETSSVSLMV